MGKREISQLEVIDLIVSILIAELVAISIEEYKQPMAYTIIPIFCLVALEVLFAFISIKSRKFRTIFDGKPLGIVTASANGEKGHEELQLIMKTLMTNFNNETTLLIQGVKGKVNSEGKIIDKGTLQQLEEFTAAYNQLLT